jgi:hypothetical protein
MPLAKNSVVIPAASAPSAFLGQESFGFGGSGIPLVGTVESIAPAVVCWMNGTKVTYATDTELLELGAVSANVTSFYHRRVMVSGMTNTPDNPNSQGASEGLVIGGFTLLAGANDVLVIQFSANDIAVIPASLCVAVG